MSLNRMPGLGKSGTSRIRSVSSGIDRSTVLFSKKTAPAAGAMRRAPRRILVYRTLVYNRLSP